MERIWTLREGEEQHGSTRGGIGKETVGYSFKVEKSGSFFFICSLPRDLNYSRFPSILGMFSRSARAAKITVHLSVLNDQTKLVDHEIELSLESYPNEAIHFELTDAIVPVEVVVNIQGYSFFRKLKLFATMIFWDPFRNNDVKRRASVIGQSLVNYLMIEGSELGRESLHDDLSGLTIKIVRRPELSSGLVRLEDEQNEESSPGDSNTLTKVYEVHATDSIGDAMFYLLQKGILSAPVWDKEGQRYLGMFDMTDAMHFTLRLRDMTPNSKLGLKVTPMNKDEIVVFGLTRGEVKNSRLYGLDLEVRVLFRHLDHRIPPWTPLAITTRMRQVLTYLNSGEGRIPVINPHDDQHVLKIISQSEIMNQVFHRLIYLPIGSKSSQYFNKTNVCEMAIERGIYKIFHLADSISSVFSFMMNSYSRNFVPVVDDSGSLIDCCTAADAWFLCKTDLIENANDPYRDDLNELSIGEFLNHVHTMSATKFLKTRRKCVTVCPSASTREIITLLVQYRVHSVQIVDTKESNRPIGFVTAADVLNSIVEDDVEIFHKWELISDVFFWERNRTVSVKSEDDDNEFSTLCVEPRSSLHYLFQKLDRKKDERPAISRVSSGKSFISAGIGLFLPETEYSVLSEAQQAALEPLLPRKLQAGVWKLVFRPSDHGSSVLALVQRLEHEDAPMIIALADDFEYIFGAFLPGGLFLSKSSRFEFTEGLHGNDTDSFVFTFGSKSKGDEKLRVFPWTGANRYFRVIDKNKGFGIGGGSKGFAIFLDQMLKNGSSQTSDTYGNDCLASASTFRCTKLDIITVLHKAVGGD